MVANTCTILNSSNHILYIWVELTNQWLSTQPGTASTFRYVRTQFIKLRVDGHEPANVHVPCDDVYEYIAWSPPFIEGVKFATRKKELLELSQNLNKQLVAMEQYKMEVMHANKWMVQAPETLRLAAIRALPIDFTRFNIAIVGPSGVGKSSLVNAILRVYNGDSTVHHAPIDSKKECTHECERYDLLGTAISVWDLPGGGTDRHPTSTFVIDNHVAAFDMQVIVVNNRMYDFHKMAFNAAISKFSEQHVVVAAVKCDSLVEEEVMNSRGNLTQIEAFDAIMASINDSVFAHTAGMIKHVFGFSTWALSAQRPQWMHEVSFIKHLNETSEKWIAARALEAEWQKTNAKIDTCNSDFRNITKAVNACQ
jgi:hypothetical protein